MEILQFKTNINCGGCVAKVTPGLNETEGIKTWNVDLKSPERILTVETEDVSAKDVINAVNKAGFKIEQV
ncbi:MAG TPA: heavy-metal-associated domain-containing protein [Parafilimonas sp.]|nr:heavy-metal-associated domain-containing protein [Parafilimonas sp.]